MKVLNWIRVNLLQAVKRHILLLTCSVLLLTWVLTLLYFFTFPFLLCIFLFLFILLQLSQFSPFAFLCLVPTPITAPTVHPHTVVHVHGSFIHVLWLIPAPSFHQSFPLPFLWQLSVCPCFHVSGSVLFASLFCSLDSSYKWDHMVFVFYRLAYFT